MNLKNLSIKNSEFQAIILEEHWERLSKFVWYLKGRGICIQRYAFNGRFKTKMISLAQEVMQTFDVSWDHIDRNFLNNIPSNLRLATHTQQLLNRNKQSNTSSKYIGVYWNKRDKLWRAQIVFNKKVIWLGNFKNEIDAAKARDLATIKYHGNFGVLNFPTL